MREDRRRRRELRPRGPGQSVDLPPVRRPARRQAAVQADALRAAGAAGAGHFDAVVDLYGVRRGPKMMRKFGIKYARLHPTPGRVRAAFIDVWTGSQWRAILGQVLPRRFRSLGDAGRAGHHDRGCDLEERAMRRSHCWLWDGCCLPLLAAQECDPCLRG